MPDRLFGLYIHWPFCLHKCPYCDFNSHVSNAIDHEAWEQSFKQQLDYFSDYLHQQTITSIFFGGGTPSLMPPRLVASLLDYIQQHYKLSDQVEITLEANPTSIERKSFGDFYHAGINRFSIGVQSLREKDLAFLGRQHSVEGAKLALEQVATITDRFSFDLIYARPEQTLNDWRAELTEALQYASSHLSLYQLTIEKGTPFYKAYQQKEFIMPDEELSADMFALTQEMTGIKNLHAYEISNHAVQGYESKHNVNYWQYGEYLGIGPGAHSRIRINQQLHALVMLHQPDAWLKQLKEGKDGIQQQSIIDNEAAIEEAVMTGLRLKTGINREYFNNIFKKDIVKLMNQKKINRLLEDDLMIVDSHSFRASAKGFPLINSIVQYLLT